MVFYSISDDGFIFQWVITSMGMTESKVMPIDLDIPPCPGPEGTSVRLKGCGRTMCFHPTDPLICLIGTEEGFIHKCNITYASNYLFTYAAHRLPVYKINFNKFNSDIFISCSAGWGIKMWEDCRESPVEDVEWAPYSSTVFGAATSDGRVHIFDVNVDKYNPICSQQVVSKKRNKLTKLAFNSYLPFIVVGDIRGVILSLKLSPNCRKKVKPPKKGPQLTNTELEVNKLTTILSHVREDKQLVPPPDRERAEEEEEARHHG
ncbi:Dynein intermediate chain 1, axonemal [Gryllus bimaculatus]|nr:Dynein intermediate chain 1, axonemal [Gryllus bimaculatus]